MRFLVDECVAKSSAIRLRMLGHDVVRIGTDIRIAEDVDILALATSEMRTVITHDQDFGELAFKREHRAPHGIVLFRYEPPTPEEVANRLSVIIRSGIYRFEGYLTAVDEGKVRQRPC
ncbi:MAG: DUF5615 family PIN-like protein [Bacteroidetes bacterium]|nr:DUF5615 family PIN-like protein [Bacteroidota bacterium]MBS1943881.1 DUF5615 family PIN-like protein [Bacteroidota bacterium]